MKKYPSASALVMACAATIGVWAQSARSNSSPSNTNRFIVLGCISRAPASSTAGRGTGAARTPRFLLTDTRSDPPTVYELQGDASQLGLHVGHTVEIAGPLSASSETAAGRGQSLNALTLKVTSLTWISKTCAK